MKTLKKLSSVILICLVLLVTQTVFAQKENGHRGKRPTVEQRVKHMTTELNLTEEQQTQVKGILENTKLELEAIKEKDGEREEKKEAFHEVMERQEKQISEVLTEEQKVKKLELQKERKAKMEEKRAAVQEKRDLFKEMKAELEAYRVENIAPVTQKQREKLEVQLSKKHKKELANIRVKLKENKKEFEKFKYENRYHMISAAGLRGSLSEEYKELRETRKAEMDKAKAIEKKYTAEIQALQGELQSQAEQWKADMKAIKEKYIPKDHEVRKRPSHAKKHMLKDENFDMDEHKRVRFLLQEPSGDVANEVDGTVKVFPNPAQGQVTIEYTLTKGGKVSLELQNYIGRGGRLVFNNRYHEAGTYQEVVNLEGLTDTNYMVGLFTPDGHVVTTQLVIKQ